MVDSKPRAIMIQNPNSKAQVTEFGAYYDSNINFMNISYIEFKILNEIIIIFKNINK